MRFPNPITFLRSIRNAIKARLNSQPILAPSHVRQHRLRTCAECPHYDYHIAQCNACTCFVKLKAAMSFERCPLDKWGRTWEVVDIK